MNMLIAAAKGQRIDYVYSTASTAAQIEASALTRTDAFPLDGMIAGARAFCLNQAKQVATVGSPYVAGERDVVPMEFTAAIRIHGSSRGTVYVGASRAMLTIMMMRMGATDITTENMRKTLRNLASAMVAHARRDCGDEVLVSDPSVAVERMEKIDDARDAALIVPIHWRKFTLQVIACLE